MGKQQQNKFCFKNLLYYKKDFCFMQESFSLSQKSGCTSFTRRVFVRKMVIERLLSWIKMENNVQNDVRQRTTVRHRETFLRFQNQVFYTVFFINYCF